MRTSRSSSRAPGRLRLYIVLAVSLLAALFFWGGKWGGLAAFSPLLLILLLCPFIHYFMHGGHGSSSAGESDQPGGRGGAHRH